MEDVQNSPAPVALPIDRVGVKGLKLPLLVRDRAQGTQHTVANVDVSVDLPAAFKGTHMSRFVQALANWTEDLDYAGMKRLLEDVRERLTPAGRILSFISVFCAEERPRDGLPRHSALRVQADRRVARGRQAVVPARSDGSRDDRMPVLEGHQPRRRAQPAGRRAHGGPDARVLLDRGFHRDRRASGSSPVYSLLKREDEKFVTEDAFSRPTFVEDVVRNVASRLADHPHVSGFRVEVESYESIHAHNAFACIEHGVTL